MNRLASSVRSSRGASALLRASLVWGALSAALGGCATTLAQVQGSGVVGTSGALGGGVEGSYGIGAGGVGIEAAVRSKFTTDVISGALGGGLFAAGGGEYGGPMIWAHLGMHALQLDVIDQTPYVSAFSPYLTGGLGICLDGCSSPTSSSSYLGVSSSTTDQTVLTIGLAAEYDVRFVRDGEAFFGLSVGYAHRTQQHTRLPF